MGLPFSLHSLTFTKKWHYNRDNVEIFKKGEILCRLNLL